MKTAVAIAVLAAALTLCWLSSRDTATQPTPPVEQPLEVPAPPPADEAPRIAGRVVDHEGRPVSGAKIEVRANVASLNSRGPVTEGPVLQRTASDGDGRFVFELDELSLMGGELLLLRVSHPELGTRVRYPLKPWRRADRKPVVQMGLPNPLQGMVVDPSGEPVPDAVITLYRPAWSGRTRGALVVVGQERSDDQGRFFIHDRDEPELLVAARDGVFAARHVSRWTRSPCRVVLESGSVISGRVLDDRTSLPIADAELRLTRHQEDGIGPQTQARADGSWELTLPSGLRGDPWALEVSAPRFAETSCQIREKDAASVTLRLRPATRILGQLRDARSGVPISDFVVHFSCGGRQFSRFLRHSYRDAKGRFALQVRASQAGLRELRITAPGYAPAYLPDVLVYAEQDCHVALELSRGTTLTGRIVGPGGEPVSDARVEARPASCQATDALSNVVDLDQASDHPHAWTDARGRFLIPNAPSGEAIVAIRHIHHPARNIPPLMIPEGGKLALGTLDLNAGATLRGRVRGGAPDGGWVTATDAGERASGSMISMELDAFGAFELTGLPPCQLRLGRTFGGCSIMGDPVVVVIEGPGEYGVELPNRGDCE